MDYRVPSVDIAVKIIGVIRKQGGAPCGITELCRALSIHKSTCYSIVKTLEQHGFLAASQDKKYSLGLALIELGSLARQNLSHVAVARPYLTRLAEETGLSVVFTQRTGKSKLIAIDRVQSSSRITPTIALGADLPLTYGAAGKCFLAFTDDQEVEEILRLQGLPGYTVKSITDGDAYRKEIREVRQLGYAECHEEHTLGISAVASPVFDADNKANFAVSLLGFSSVFAPGYIAELAPRVVQTARQISTSLGASVNQD